jgi:hypothetical protein
MANIAKPIPLPPVPVRSTAHYTVGSGSTTTPLITTATSPSVGNPQQNIQSWNVIGIDYQPYTMSFAGGAANTDTSTTLVVPFPRIPTGITFNSNDTLFLDVTVPTFGTYALSALTLPYLVITTPQATAGTTVYTGPYLSPGLQYVNYSVSIRQYIYFPVARPPSTGQWFVRAVLYQLPGE